MRRLLLVVAALAVVGGGVALLLGPESGGTPATTSSTTTATVGDAPTTIAGTTAGGSTTSTTPPGPPIPVPAAPAPTPPAPSPGLPPDFTGTGAVVIADGGAGLAAVPGEDPFIVAREGLVMAAEGFSPDHEWVRIFHMCDDAAWVPADRIAAIPPAATGPIGPGFDFADAVIVVDPGHGGPNIGASGAGDLPEKDVNVLIAARVRDLLAAPHSIDWETGAILEGDGVPAAGTVIVTRVGDGAAADYEAGLDFRARLANAVDAHAMVSIHNNAGWERRTSLPGSDAYYQSQPDLTAQSRRLAVLLVEELRRGFGAFDARWVGAIELGAKSRLSPRDGRSQYYGILKEARIPTVIAEGAYIANPSEAALLETADFQQAYAAAVYRALVRFLTTDDPGGAPSYDPEVWDGFAGRGGARDTCVIPAQRG